MNQIDAQIDSKQPDKMGSDSDGPGPRASTPPEGRNARPAVLFVGSGAVGDAMLAEASDCGFSHVLIGLGSLSHADGVPEAHAERTQEARLAAVSDRAAGHGFGLLLDLVIDRGTGEAGDGLPFLRPDPDAALDPRSPLLPGVAALRDQGDEGAMVLADWWAGRIARWVELGVAGFRLHGIERLTPSARAIVLPALRKAAGQGLLIAWPSGNALHWSGGVDASVLDFVGLDCGEETGLSGRAARRRAFGKLISAPGDDLSARASRHLHLAAMTGEGWIVSLRVAARERALVRSLNALRAAWRGEARFLTGDDASVIAIARQDAPLGRDARETWLCLANRADTTLGHVDPGLVLPGIAGGGQGFAPALAAGGMVVLGPAEARVFASGRVEFGRVAPLDPDVAASAAAAPRLAIEAPSPYVADGHLAAKRLVGEAVVVEADIICDGHDKLAAVVLWRVSGETAWRESKMRPLGNDRWSGSFPLSRLARHEFQIEAWYDRFATFRDELTKKHAAGVNTALEVKEGAILVARAASRSGAPALAALGDRLERAPADEARAILLGDKLAGLMAAADDRPFSVRLDRPGLVDAERLEAGFAAWYEVFPRSLSDDTQRHGTFADVIRHLPRVRAMGFDVLYFPPIHPIGRKNRKGRNNSLNPAPDDPGSPYAIGSEAGGHDALHPELGTLEDFRALVAAAAEQGIELAIDFAVQCSPDHPWLREHAGWFDWRPDGSIRYAENPPKKYEDIVNVDFYADDAKPSLWIALCEIVLFWAAQGVRLFRVDNPHTKPFPFWEWLIAEVRSRYPDSVFLAEAFTRPRIMGRLAKIGFSQSYTYFTWRDNPAELRAYVEELAYGPNADVLRPHFFVNTPDINPVFLQTSGRPGYLIRAALAATLSGLWGLYNGFELCEGTPMPGKEEYLNSEKYQLRAWDWNRPGNIVAEVTRLNAIRHENPALRSHKGVVFLDSGDDAVLAYEKATADRSNVLLVVVSLDPYGDHTVSVDVPLWRWGLPDDGALRAVDCLADDVVDVWHGRRQVFALNPAQPYRVFRLAPTI